MIKEEKDELHEIQQVFEDALVRADMAFTEMKGKSEHLSQAIKVMLHVRKRLKALANGTIK